MYKRICKNCGTIFDCLAKRRYFCDDCKKIKAREYRLNYAIRAVYKPDETKGAQRTAICKGCKVKFQAKMNQIYCVDCQRARYNKYGRKLPFESYKIDEEGKLIAFHTCVICGADFWGDVHKKYCSKKCRNKGQRKRCT